MGDILDELRPDCLRMVDGVATPTVEVPEELLLRAIGHIKELREFYENAIATWGQG